MESLFALIREGKTEDVRKTITNNPGLVTLRDEGSSFTALHFAASQNKLDIVRLLLDTPGCDANVQTLGGKTFRDIAKAKGFGDIQGIGSSSNVAAAVKDVSGFEMRCAVCGSVDNLSRCARCKRSYYCSIDHQRSHWTGGHKLICGASNARFVLAKRPKANELTKDLFDLREDVPLVLDGDVVVVKNLFLSLDPYMRGRLADKASYAEPQKLGDVMLGETIGEVVLSNVASVRPGAMVHVWNGGWQKFVSCKAAELEVIETFESLPITVHFSALGMPAVVRMFVVCLFDCLIV
jgi:hypothetical protein